jgi:hypothetical protein
MLIYDRLAEFLLEGEICWTEVVEKTKTHILRSKTFFQTSFHL